MHKILKLRWSFVFQLLTFLFIFSDVKAQDETACDTSVRYLYWTGEIDNDFFNEKNWRVTVEKNSATFDPGKPTCLPGGGSHLYSICPNVHDPVNDKYPRDKSLEPGQPIRFNLYIESADVTANGGISFACSQKGITLTNAQLTVLGGTVSRGALSLLNESTVHLKEGGASSTLLLNFLDAASWVYTHEENPDGWMTKLNQILVNHTAGTLNDNFRINQYYQKGSVIRPVSATYPALRIFSASNQQGNSATVFEDIIYKGAAIPGNMDQATHSFILKRGYMATFAVNTNGTGKSRVYIASEEDLTINTLDAALQGNVRFIRVVPWNWASKKGTGFYFDLNAGWYYNWNFNGTSKPNTEYVPMAWGASGALPPALNQIIQRKTTTHVLGFNESDNCEDQSGQFNNLCKPEVAVAYYENLMGLGVRLGTPAPRENGHTTWLKDFARIAKEKNVRFDFVAVHWYDWGSNPVATPNASAEQIFNRFKTYLQNVYNQYQLPIWLTEFNANPNRSNATQEAFLNLALPYLESLDYVERYAYFQPVSNNANYFDAGGALTNIGTLYKNHTSSPSMPAPSYTCANNLDGLDQPYVPQPITTLVYEAECGSYPGNQWQVLENEQASNGLYIKGNTTLTGATALAKQIHFEFDIVQAGTYRLYIRSSSNGTNAPLRIRMDGNEFEQITPFNSSSFTWLQVPRFYELNAGKHRLSFEIPGSAALMIDQVAFTTGPDDLDAYKKDAGYCTPGTLKWGMEATDIISFYEAEATSIGSNWSSKISANAIGGSYLASAENITSPDVPDSDDKVMTFTISVDQSDEYELWAKIQAIAATESSLWISVDNEPYKKWNNLANPVYEWYWKKIYHSYGTENRSFTYFLEAGEHQVKIAVSSGNVAVDRLAIVTKGKLPETVDPNVLLLQDNLEFEAENARFIAGAGTTGTVPTTQNCSTSSNLLQVNLGTRSGNWIAFENVVAEEAGPYKLKVSYMSKNSRPFRIRVNGTTLGRQVVTPSGNWCFIATDNPTLGSPAIYEVVVILKRGLNTIEIGLNNTELAPFIDKIKLEKAPLNNLSLEAELAELTGSSAIVTCTNASASNGSVVNMGFTGKIKFNNLIAEESKTYQVDIYYVTTVARELKLSINGQSLPTENFAASGLYWCSQPGSVIAVKSVEMTFVQGINYIELSPAAGKEAPFIDRIVIKEPVPPVTPTANSVGSSGITFNNEIMNPAASFNIYPNPLRAGSPLTITLPERKNESNKVHIQVTDVSGRIVFSQTVVQQHTRQIQLAQSFSKGMYIISVVQGDVRSTKKIIVQ